MCYSMRVSYWHLSNKMITQYHIEKERQYLNKVLHLIASPNFEKILITTLEIPFKFLLCYDSHLVCKCGYI